MKLFRYADDCVICCQNESDAIRTKTAIEKRLAKFKLAMNQDKTKLVKFSKISQNRDFKQETFDFLGFTFYLGKSKSGFSIPKVKTRKDSFRAKLKRVKAWVKSVKNWMPLEQLWKTFCAKLRGHIQYYGVSFNSKSVYLFSSEAQRIVFRGLNNRSQKKSFTWEQFNLYRQKYPPPTCKMTVKLY